MTLNKYIATLDYVDWRIVVEIQDEINGIPTMGYIKYMVEFWTGYESRLDDSDGDYTFAFLKQLCAECFKISLSENCGVSGLIREFEGREGWVKMDGTSGIKITEADHAEIYHYDITVKSTPI